MANNPSSIVSYKRPQFFPFIFLFFCPKVLCAAKTVRLPFPFVINLLKPQKGSERERGGGD
jgi:hypothetical protein